MPNLRRPLAGPGAAARVILFLLLAIFAASPVLARADQQKPAERKYDKEQTQEIEALARLVTDVALGAAAPADFPIAWQSHFRKTRDLRTFVSYVVAIPPGAMTTPSVVMYVRAIKKAGEADAAKATPDPAAASTAQKQAKPAERGDYAWEDAYFIDVKTPEGKDPYRILRALTVLPGEYTVYLAVRERPAGEKKPGSGKTALITQPLTVPDFWQPGLTTSSIFVAGKVELLKAPAPESQLGENPYDFGTTRVIPAPENHKFSKKEDISVIFLVYNVELDKNTKKPDVTVEYTFNQKTEGGEQYFNKTNPQNFNAETLAPAFDAAAGQNVISGQTVPLASFPEGGYRLEIKVTDKIAGKSIVRSVDFVVTQ